MPFEYGDLPLKTTHLRQLVPPFCIVNSSSIGILENVGIIPLHSHVGTIRLIQLTYFACVLPPQRNRVDPTNAHNVRIQVFYCYTCDVGIYLSQVYPQVQQYVELKLLLWVRAFTPICDITGVWWSTCNAASGVFAEDKLHLGVFSGSLQHLGSTWVDFFMIHAQVCLVYPPGN